ncbi:MAG: hypothetical protein RBU45_25665 [Myxococcota bacterium]|nr:hypothetical protein [Myxococcota bacterium]
MKRTVTTCVDVPRGGSAAASRGPLRIELTFAVLETPPVEQPPAVGAAPAAGEPAVPAAGKQKDPGEERGAPRTDLRPSRRRTLQEASAPPPRVCTRQASEVATRIAAALGAEAASGERDPEALLAFADRLASGYLAAMQTVSAGGPSPPLLRVRVGEAGGRTFVDLEP